MKLFRMPCFKKQNFSKVKTYLDSGANEFMLKDKNMGKNLKNVRTVIETAGGSKELKATSAGQVDFFFADCSTPVPMGKENRALFSRGWSITCHPWHAYVRRD